MTPMSDIPTYPVKPILSAIPTHAILGWLHAPGMSKGMTLGDRIRLLRKKRGEVQAVVAEAVGVSRGAYTAIETGGDAPGRETLIAIADYFGASLDWLEGRTHKITAPECGQLVEDPDELALLAFWRSLTVEQRELMTRMLGAPAATGRSAA